MKVLVLNCGSSSIKYQLFEMPNERVVAKGLVERIGEDLSQATQWTGDEEIKIKKQIKDHSDGLEIIKGMLTDVNKGPISSMDEIGACGHRVVHGGEAVTGSVLIDKGVENIIYDFSDLAPLHNPPNLIGIREARTMMREIKQIACFDTAFHQTIPQKAFLYGLPYEMYEKHRIRKYGFHGTSHKYVSRRAAVFMKKDKFDVDLITCHLGNGCSITAVKNGRSIDTSMGLTPLEGVVMGTRTGDFDPAIVLYLLKRGYKADDLDGVFNKKSGMLGLSGISNDMRDLVDKAGEGNKRAGMALDIFAYRIKKYIGMYLAVLNGCDAIVFTGGIGENNTVVREMILDGLDGLGIEIDKKLNVSTLGEDSEIQSDNSRIKILVIPTDEERAIAIDVYKIVTDKPGLCI